MNKLVLIFCIIGALLTPELSMAEGSSCKPLSEFVPYKAGVKVEKRGEHKKAFDIYCHLAIQGDYRAQFKIAQYFDTGIKGELEPNLVHSYVWAKYANHYVKSRKRAEFAANIGAKLTEEQRAMASSAYTLLASIMPGGLRIDMQYKPIDIAKLLKEKRKKKKFTGSNIKRDEAPTNLGIVEF
ncbi:MAG: hypothetical protein OQK51_14605 [Kangiellaceae bacterium]|nr:hypothetical protein [Kangiellaceae bacterium]